MADQHQPLTGPTPPTRTVLHLSGPRLRAALERAIQGSEPVGGAERFVAALKLKQQVIAERITPDRITTLTRSDFEEMCLLMSTVRRRIGALLHACAWPDVRSAIIELLHDAHKPGTADMRMQAFEKTITRLRGPARSSDTHAEETDEGTQTAAAQEVDRHRGPLSASAIGAERGSLRFVRDLAAEILHAAHPEHYPLMARWVWDARANTGALREIWHDPVVGESTDNLMIDVPDDHDTFLVLREELAQFLSENGVFRDVLWYVDLLLGQVYGDYINAQGGAYLKTDFGATADPIEHTRRILGVDARIARGATRHGAFGLERQNFTPAIGKNG
jgi:hypothetical protein